MVFLQYIIVAALFSVAWMVITVQINLWGFIIGFVLSFPLVVILLREREIPLNPLRLPVQLVGLVWYTAVLALDIFNSGIDVTLRALNLRPINPGIIKVDVKDDSEVIIAMTAHGITITPGELVVSCEDHYVFVHCLDMDSSLPVLEKEQAARLKHLRRIIGR